MSDKYGWQAIADCPGVPCNKPECIYYDQPDDFTWTCSIPRIQDVAAALVAANARADAWQRLSELQDRLLACYRTGKNPGAILDKLAAAREAVRHERPL